MTSEGQGRGDGRHAGEIELKKLGHLLLGYLAAMGGRMRAPRYLGLEERPMRGVETCALCGVTIAMGEVWVRNLDRDLAIRLPFIAVHALVTHGERTFHGGLYGQGEIDVERLKDVLNYEEYRIGRLLTGLLAHTSLVPEHLTIEERMMRGVIGCGECGDLINMGSFRIANTDIDEALEIPYLALHALVEHRDITYSAIDPAAGDGDGDGDESSDGAPEDPPTAPRPSESPLDIERLRRILGRSQAHAEFGRRLTGYLKAFGGDESPPRHLHIDEHPAAEDETCARSGETVNAGYVELRNTHTGHGMQLPYLALHALATHGDAYHRGTIHRGWVDLPLLQRLVKRTWPIVQRVRRTPR